MVWFNSFQKPDVKLSEHSKKKQKQFNQLLDKFTCCMCCYRQTKQAIRDKK